MKYDETTVIISDHHLNVPRNDAGAVAGGHEDAAAIAAFVGRHYLTLRREPRFDEETDRPSSNHRLTADLLYPRFFEMLALSFLAGIAQLLWRQRLIARTQSSRSRASDPAELTKVEIKRFEERARNIGRSMTPAIEPSGYLTFCTPDFLNC
jgi:hypothetical protein